MEFFPVFYALAIAAFASARLILQSRRKYFYALTLVLLVVAVLCLPLGTAFSRLSDLIFAAI